MKTGRPSTTAKKITRGSWWHVAELRHLTKPDDKIQECDFGVVPLLDSKIRRRRSRFGRAVRNYLASRTGRFAEKHIERRRRRVSHRVHSSRTLVEQSRRFTRRRSIGVGGYRKVENEIPPVRVAPGLIESEGFDQPLYIRGNHKQPSEAVPRGFLTSFGGKPFSLQHESGRLALAEEFTRQDNPLFARVIVNRLWHHVYGVGLVKTTDKLRAYRSKADSSGAARSSGRSLSAERLGHPKDASLSTYAPHVPDRKPTR